MLLVLGIITQLKYWYRPITMGRVICFEYFVVLGVFNSIEAHIGLGYKMW